MQITDIALRANQSESEFPRGGKSRREIGGKAARDRDWKELCCRVRA
jgi:hypothetical protein